MDKLGKRRLETEKEPEIQIPFSKILARLHPDFLYFYSLQKAIFKIG